jgi:hypothetical protein
VVPYFPRQTVVVVLLVVLGSACGPGAGTGATGATPITAATTVAPSTSSMAPAATVAPTTAATTAPASTATPTPASTITTMEVAPTTPAPTEAATWPESVLAIPRVVDDPHREGYDRDDWGRWSDDDGDCLNTRHEVLMAEATASPFLRDDGCLVTGGRWLAAFTGTVVEDPRSLDVDHFVPLANAHRSGGWAWDRDTKRRYSNDMSDPRHLIAVTASANRSKGDSGPEDWTPREYAGPDAMTDCVYADTWLDIKVRWVLSVTSAELVALTRMLATCDGDPDSQIAPGMTISLGEPIDLGAPIDLGGSENGDDPPNPGDVRNCGDFDDYAAAKAWFDTYADAYGDVAHLDGDNDGEPCESLPGGP